MHYTGMMAYRVDGLVEWNYGYVAASIVISIVFSAMAVRRAARGASALDRIVAFALFALAIVGLHFTAMAAVWVLPLRTGAAGTRYRGPGDHGDRRGGRRPAGHRHGRRQLSDGSSSVT